MTKRSSSEISSAETPSESIENALASLSTLLQKKQKELVEREAELSKAQEKFEVERSGCYGDTAPSDVLHLNVGGKSMAVLRRTLTSVEGSMLASRFSGRWDDSIEKDENGHYFIDQEFDLFEKMINYLRHRSNETDQYPVKSPCSFNPAKYRGEVEDFYRMVEYYGMTLGIFPSELKVVYKNGGEDAVTLPGLLEVNATEWCTLEISRHGHNRVISAYEVTLGPVQRVQIGWLYTPDKTHPSYGNSIGVGDVENTLSLDLSRSCFLNNSHRTDISGLELKEGTVVRSEDFGNRWFVDGRLVASINEDDPAVTITGASEYDAKYMAYMIPLLSVKGDAKISAIEYRN